MATDETRLSYADWCRLSQAYNESANLWLDQDRRINEWLKENIAKAKRHADGTAQAYDDLQASGGLGDAP